MREFASDETGIEPPPPDTRSLTPAAESVEADVNRATPDVEGETIDTKTFSVDAISCQVLLATCPARFKVFTESSYLCLIHGTRKGQCIRMRQFAKTTCCASWFDPDVSRASATSFPRFGDFATRPRASWRQPTTSA